MAVQASRDTPKLGTPSWPQILLLHLVSRSISPPHGLWLSNRSGIWHFLPGTWPPARAPPLRCGLAWTSAGAPPSLPPGPCLFLPHRPSSTGSGLYTHSGPAAPPGGLHPYCGDTPRPIAGSVPRLSRRLFFCIVTRLASSPLSPDLCSKVTSSGRPSQIIPLTL